MTQIPVTEPGVPAVLDNFDSLEALFDRGTGADKDLSLCFLCLRWTTGDEGCRRGDRCELEAQLDQLESAKHQQA
jgi:hypothetical protein